MQLTEDAIHNWTEAYIQRQYKDLPAEVQAAVKAAMIRHHQKGTSARDEATQINTTFDLR